MTNELEGSSNQAECRTIMPALRNYSTLPPLIIRTWRGRTHTQRSGNRTRMGLRESKTPEPFDVSRNHGDMNTMNDSHVMHEARRRAVYLFDYEHELR